MLKIIQM